MAPHPAIIVRSCEYSSDESGRPWVHTFSLYYTICYDNRPLIRASPAIAIRIYLVNDTDAVTGSLPTLVTHTVTTYIV